MFHEFRTARGLCLVLLSTLCAGPAASALQTAEQPGEQPSAASGTPGAWGRTDTATAAPPAIVASAQYVGATVHSSDGKVLGPVVDLGIDGRDGAVLFVAIASDKGIGTRDRLTAVPIKLLAFGPDGLGLVGVSRARFAGAPRFMPETWPDASDVVAYAAWTATVWHYFDETPTWNFDGPYEPYTSGEQEPPADGSPIPRGHEAPETPEEARIQEAGRAANLLNRPDGVRASALVTADVFDGQKQRCGRVRAVCIDQRTGRIACLAVARRETSGVTGSSVDDSVLLPLPWRALNCRLAGERVFTNLTPEQFDQAPDFPASTWPDLAAPEWQQRLDTFYPPIAEAPAEAPQAPQAHEAQGAPPAAGG